MPVIQGSCGNYSVDTVHQIDVCLARLYDSSRRSKDPVRAVQLLDDADQLLDARWIMQTDSDQAVSGKIENERTPAPASTGPGHGRP